MRHLTLVLLALAATACGLDPDADGRVVRQPDASAVDALVDERDAAADTTLTPDATTEDTSATDLSDVSDEDVFDADGSAPDDPGDVDADVDGAPADDDVCTPNGCGGCAALPALGDPCGPCSLDAVVCDGPDAVRCSGETACPIEPNVIVGTGITAFVAPSPGDVFMLTQGVQGGFHIWGGVSASGVEPRSVELEFTATNAAGDVVASVFWLADLMPVGGRLQASGITVFVAPAVVVDAVDDEPWRLCVALTDAAGESASDCVDVTARCCTLLSGG